MVTFGGNLTVPKLCIAVISRAKEAPNQHVVSLLYKAVVTGGFKVSMGRSKASTYKAQFTGMSDYTRTAGKQVGVIYRTLADAANGTPTAKDFVLNDIFQGPADLWAIDAPTDADVRVTLDGTTLTPDSAKHPNAKHLGGTTGAVDFSVTPKLEFNRMDQFDAPVDVFIGSIEAKIEAEMAQSGLEKMARALGVGTFTESEGAYEQMVFGGTNQPPKICVCAIGRKRSDPTKAAVACLYNVNSAEGVTLTASRQKASAYKVSFNGLLDPTRTAGKQMGVFHEMV
jgi:hypothetical protein